MHPGTFDTYLPFLLFTFDALNSLLTVGVPLAF